MLNRRFSVRERILLLVLIILFTAALYMIVVFNPTANSVAAAQNERITLEAELAGAQAKAEKLAEMQQNLQDMKDSGTCLAVTPAYDNIGNVAPMLNAALAKASEFDLRFMPVTFSDNFAVREISMVFAADSYRIAEGIIEELSTGPYSCDISVLRIESADSGDTGVMSGEVAVSLTIIYYEAYRQAAD